MRTGACTLQQALSAEAASVLKVSLSLARRRGHAHVTPLHVAATLLTSPASSLLRRACLKSQPHHLPSSHPLQCRALELCFNVALNRLPTAPPPTTPSSSSSSSCSLLASYPSLSNALIAALKRAQAHQRRGCIDLQQQHQHHQQQPPLLAVKVELEQLIISILDDPSVSRVMREAGFSSTCVKNSLEEEGSVLSQSNGLWQSSLLKLSSSSCSRQIQPKEDVSAVLEVMLTSQGGRKNVVVLGDTVSVAEAVVAEFMAKVERGDVPDELKSAHFVKLNLSYVHLRLMSKSDVDLKISNLRRKFGTLVGSAIVYAGDLRWAVDEEAKDGCGFRPVQHMVAELGRLMRELRCSNGGAAVWLLGTATYQIYMRCQKRQPSLETQWALHAVAAPSGGLALSLQSLQAPSGLESRLAKLFEHPFQVLGSKSQSTRVDDDDDDEKLNCCAECSANFEKEALVFKSEVKDTNCGSTQLPPWLQKHRPDNHKNALLELTKKWNNHCQSLHHSRQNRLYPPSFLSQSSIGKSNTYSSNPWWPNSCQSKTLMQSHRLSFSETCAKVDGGFPFNILQPKKGMGSLQETERDGPKGRSPEVSLNSLTSPGDEDVGITLSLGSGALVTDSATSNKKKQAELLQKLHENMPWQSQVIPSIVESLNNARAHESKGLRVLLQGSDWIAKKRLTRLMLQHFGGSKDRLVELNMRKWPRKGSSCREMLQELLEKDSKSVVLVEEIDRADNSFVRYLTDVLNVGAFQSSAGKRVQLAETIFILTTSNSSNYGEENVVADNVIKIKLQAEEKSIAKEAKRKAETTLQSKPKRLETEQDRGLDLNLVVEEGEELADGESKDDEASPSDLTNETDCTTPRLPSDLLKLVTTRFTLDTSPERSSAASKTLISKLHRAFDEVRSAGGSEATLGTLLIDETAADELTAAAGFFLESCFERWVGEVFKAGLHAVRKGGNVRVCVEGKEGSAGELGFMGSILPRRLHVVT